LISAKKCILIIGPHRSGTSAFSGVLSELGVTFGSQLLSPSFDNPKGFFENEEVVKINDQILRLFGFEWYTSSPLPDHFWKDSRVKDIQSKALQLLEKEYSSESIFAIKDPRISLTFPFWERAIREWNEKTSIVPIIIIRSPEYTVSSLMKRNEFNKQTSESTTLLHLLSAEKVTRHLNRYIIDYSDLLKKPETTLSSLLSELTEEQANVNKAISFLDSSLQSRLPHDMGETSVPLQKVYGHLKKNTLDYEFLDASITQLKEISEPSSSSFKIIRVIWASLGIILLNPGSFLKHFNSTNLKTLIKAVRQEKVSTIVSNLRKLLN